jgi:uncharacterized Zn finger protein
MKCDRCQGLCDQHVIHTAEGSIDAIRCLACGYYFEPIMDRNRKEGGPRLHGNRIL